MARASIAFSNFSAGQLSSRLDGRTDLAKYFNGCTTLTNFLVHPHGGATRRPGTYFAAEVKTSSKATRLIPFEFNTDQTYIIELGDQYMRFFTNNGQIVEGNKTISGATQANPCVITSSSHGYENNQEITISSVVGMSELNGKRYLVKNKTTNTFELTNKDGTNINSTSFTAYGSAGVANRIYEITSPFLEAQLFDVKFAQSADTMWMVHPSHFPRKLTRTGNTAWTLTQAPLEYGPMQDENTSDTTLTASARTGSSCTITASADTFASTDVGRLIKIYDGWVKIDTFNSATEVVGTVQDNLEGRAELLPEYTAATIAFVEGDPSATGAEHNDRITDTAKKFIEQGFKVGHTITVSGTSSNNKDLLIVSVTDDTILTAPSDDLAAEGASSGNTLVGKLEATDEWSLGAFSDTTGYPSAVCFFEERLVYAGTTNQPQTVFFSESGGFDQFADGADDGDAMIYSIASSQVNKIRYLSPGRVLIIGTSAAEFAAQGSSANEPITPTSINIKRQTTYGTATVSPVQTGNVVLFLQRAQRKIRELVYNFDVDGYIAPDMTLLAEDITSGGIVDMDIQQEPDNVLWCCRADGALLGMTYRREENVVAWHKHDLGGSGAAESVAVIPGDLDEDQVWILTKRTINSVTRRYVEYIKAQEFGAVTDAFFVDSGLTYSGGATTSITGLDHLEGASVAILADGSTHPNKTVSSGAITLERSSTKVHVGLPYSSTLRTMRVEGGSVDGSSQGKIKRIHDVTVRLHNTVGAKVGPSSTDLDLIPFRSSADEMDTALDLFTGDKDIEFKDGYTTDGHITVVQDQPLPMTILAVYARLQTFDA
tara:strand:- start:128 stop:2611 length:2484 start_codon:yes stop_codon:yes gene_type:complete